MAHLTYDSRELEGLPLPVQRYFRAVLKDGQRIIGVAQFTHTGTFNMGETTPNWRPFWSSQIVTTRPPGFDWDGRVRMAPGLNAFVHDAYVSAEGLLHATLLGLVTVADVRGTPDAAAGELLRYLAETVWYPTALLPGQGVHWTEIDENTARATLTDGPTTVSLDFRFGHSGLIESIYASARPRIVDGTVTRMPWRARVWAYDARDGVRIPLEGEVAWVLPDGPYPYWRGRITSIEYRVARSVSVSAGPINDRLCDVVLRDGSTLPLHSVRQDDIGALVTFFAGLSPESRYYRFFGVPNMDPARVAGLIPVETTAGAALVGECGGRIVAFAGYYRTANDPDRAEVAFAIADAFQGRGIGTRLLEQLASLARTERVRTFDAYVLGENRKMMDVFLESGFRVSRRFEGGVFHVDLSLEPTLEFAEKAAKRSQLAATASMKGFFEPRTVAVVGANRERGKIGSEILHNLQTAGFTGTIIPVHPTARELQGLRAYPRVADIPGVVDLAIIVVPAMQVMSVVEDCIAKGVRALCVISAGFGEAGPEGRARELAILEKVRSAGCRLVGPNCMGLLNTDPAVRLNATFSPVYPPSGGVAMSTQSGALGLAILDYARQLNIGISSFVSVGNKIDVSGQRLDSGPGPRIPVPL